MSAVTKASILSNPAPSARNAVRHGLSGSHFVPEHARDHVAAILSDIQQQFRIGIFAEKAVAEEMALCRWQVFEADRLLDERQQIEMAEAGRHYDKFLETEQADFLNVLALDPARGISLLKHNIYGNDTLIETWTEIRHLVDQRLPFSTDLLRRMVAALGSHWQLDKISHKALLAASLCLAVGPHPDDAELIAKAWVREIDPELADFAARRLGEYRKRFGLAPDAQSQLIAIIDDNLKELKSVKDRLEANLEQSIVNFATLHAGHGMCDPLLIKEIALLQRYRTRALNRITRLELQIEKGRANESPTSMARQIRQQIEEKEFRDALFSMPSEVKTAPTTAENRPEKPPAEPAKQPVKTSQPIAMQNLAQPLRNKPSAAARTTQNPDVIPVSKGVRDLIDAPKDYSTVNFRIGG